MSLLDEIREKNNQPQQSGTLLDEMRMQQNQGSLLDEIRVQNKPEPQPVKSSSNGFGQQIGGLGKDIASDVGRVGRNLATGIGELGKVAFTDYTFKDMANRGKELAEENKAQSGQYSSDLSREVGRSFKRAGNSATFGYLEDSMKRQGFDTSYAENRGGAGGFGDIASDIAGYMVPGVGAVRALQGTRAAANVGKNMTFLPKNVRGIPQSKSFQFGKEGMAAGALFGGMDAFTTETRDPNQRDLGDHAKRLGLEATIGAVADPAIMGIGHGIARRFGRGSEIQIPQQVATARKTSAGQTKADVETGVKEFEQQVQDQLEYLNSSMGQGVEPGGLIKDELGNVVNRFGRISNNPPWYQEFYRKNGRAPNKNELKELAREQVLNGFNDTLASVPGFKPKSIRELDEQISQLQQLDQADPTISESINTLRDYRNTLETDIFNRIQGNAPNYKLNKELYDNIPFNVMNEAPNLQSPSLLDQIRGFFKSSTEDNFVGKLGDSLDKPTNDPSRLSDPKKVVKSKEDNFNSFRQKIDRNPKKRNKFSSTYQQLRTQFVEDLAPLETLEKNIRGKIPEAQDSLYKQARLFRGSPEKAHNFVRTRIRPIIEAVENAGFSYEDLGDYALARHAQDVNAQGINSGFTDNEINSVLQKLGTPQMEQARQQLVQVSTDLLRTLEDSQVLTPGMTKTLREKWPNYMPLFRSFDDDKIEFGKGMSKSLANVQNPLKKLEGSDRDVIDPIESMVKNTFKTFNVADRNRVALQLSDLAKQDASGQFVRKVKGDTARKNVVSVMEDGKKVKYEVPIEVYTTINNLNQESSNLLIKLLQKPASMLRAGATLDPVFSLRNPMRDIVQAYVVSSSGFNPIRDFPAGLFNAIFKGKNVTIGGKQFTLGKYYQDFVESNGGFGNIVSMDRDLHRKAIRQGLNQQGNTFINVLKPNQWMEILRSIADASETATKVGEFRAAKRRGVSNEEAAYRARDIMDFSRAGTSIREANKVVAFLNANIQGKSKLIRAISQNPVKVTGKAAVGVSLPTVAFYAASHLLANEKQKRAIEDAPQWLKESFWLTPVPGTDMVARIPKPFDLVLFSNPLERAMDKIIKDDPDAWDNWARELAGGQALPIMMTGLAPFVEGMANYSFFRQGPIIPQREQSLEYPDQHDIRTTGTGRFIAEQINKFTGGEGSLRNFGSPRIVDNTIQGLTAGLGSYATNAIDALFFDDYYNKPDKPAKDLLTERTPLRGFLVNEMGTGQSMNELYDLRDKLRREKGSAKDNKEPFTEGGKLKMVEDVTARIGDISTQMRTIENSEKLSSEKKRQELERLNNLRNDIAQKAWDRISRR